MCEQCTAETITLGDLFPGWRVVKATKNGNMMKAGDLGLVQSDDPDYVISCAVPCITDPSFGMNDEDFDKLAEDVNDTTFDKFMDWAYHVEASLVGHPVSGWSLVQDSKDAGWDYKKDRIFGFWLAHKIALVVENYKG
jgi:hypothetical protein